MARKYRSDEERFSRVQDYFRETIPYLIEGMETIADDVDIHPLALLHAYAIYLSKVVDAIEED